MKQLVIIWMVSMSLSVCAEAHAVNDNRSINAVNYVKAYFESRFDTIFQIFDHSNYFVEFKQISDSIDSNGQYLGVLSFLFKQNNASKTILKDTLLFFRPILKRQDFNGDGVKDLLILEASSARSNWTYHLYLVDNVNFKIILVKDFENINNPKFDSINNIIVSYTLSKIDYYSFYRINKRNVLEDLGNSFECDRTENDDVKYKKAIQKIRKE
ncbi:MAG: XAC2610-related protein [Chryseobacterium taeanense]